MSTAQLTVHQYHHSVREFDAITNQMRLIQDALREIGVGGRILATEIKSPNLGAEPFHPHRAWNCDLFLIHHSQGNPVLPSVLKIEVPKGVVYHNITPAEYFTHDPYISDLCILGRKQLLALRRETKVAFADSQFNAWELRTLGFENIGVLPLVDLTKKRAPGLLKVASKRKKRLLFVGKLTPHKNQSLLVQTLFFLLQSEPERWKLTLVGSEDPLYGRYLRKLCKILGVEQHVTFIKHASNAELERIYRTHDAFVCVSRHEGFCVPLVEAMGQGLPILAWPHGAVSETLGSAALRLCKGRPRWIAQSIIVALNDKACLKHVLKTQASRFEELKGTHNRQRIQSEILERIQSIRRALVPKRKPYGEPTLKLNKPPDPQL